MKIRSLISIFLFIFSESAFACREGFGSPWSLAESQFIKASRWISVIEINHLSVNEEKETFYYSVIKNIKGNGPERVDRQIGPFSREIKKHEIPIWKDKACKIHFSLSMHRKYILFSSLDNPNSIQSFNVENENRILRLLNERLE